MICTSIEKMSPAAAPAAGHRAVARQPRQLWTDGVPLPASIHAYEALCYYGYKTGDLPYFQM